MSGSDPTVGRLLQALRQGAVPVKEGEFSLDRDAAARKMAAFRYADPAAFLIPIVEGMFSRRAQAVYLNSVKGGLEIRGYVGEMRDPPASIFQMFLGTLASGEALSDFGLHRIGVGIDMALASDDVERIALGYSFSSKQFVAEAAERGAPELSWVHAGPSLQMRIAVEGRGLDEAMKTLASVVTHAPLPVWLDSESLSGERRSWDFETEVEGSGFRIEAGFAPGVVRPSRVELWSSGVAVGVLRREGQCFRAVIHLDRPRYDISQLRPVQDATLTAALEALDEVQVHCLDALETADRDWDARGGRPHGWPRPKVDAVLEREARKRPAPEAANILPFSRALQVQPSPETRALARRERTLEARAQLTDEEEALVAPFGGRDVYGASGGVLLYGVALVVGGAARVAFASYFTAGVLVSAFATMIGYFALELVSNSLTKSPDLRADSFAKTAVGSLLLLGIAAVLAFPL